MLCCAVLCCAVLCSEQLKIVPDIAGANASWAKAKKAHAREVSKEKEAEDMKKVGGRGDEAADWLAGWLVG
mgnify:CR=1 FL=1